MSPDDILEQTQWDTFWLPPTCTILDRPDLLCFAAPRPSPTLNAATRLRPRADAALPALLAEISALHSGPCSRIPVPPALDRPATAAALRAAAYAPGEAHDGYTIAADTPRPPLRAGLQVRRVADRAALIDAIQVSSRAFSRDERPDEAELSVYLAGCAAPDGRVHRYVVYDADGVLLASAGMTWFPALRFVFLWAGGTTPAGRGRGAYSALVTARLQKARALGAAAAGLYARLETSAPIVAAQGFTRGGRMTFWDRTSAA